MSEILGNELAKKKKSFKVDRSFTSLPHGGAGGRYMAVWCPFVEELRSQGGWSFVGTLDFLEETQLLRQLIHSPCHPDEIDLNKKIKSDMQIVKSPTASIMENEGLGSPFLRGPSS